MANTSNAMQTRLKRGGKKDTIALAHPNEDPDAARSITSVEASDQLQALYSYAKKKNIYKNLYELPPKNDYTFRLIGGEARRMDAHIHKDMLFLGEADKYQLWALMKQFDHKVAEVIFIKLDTASKIAEQVSDMAGLEFMYPFKPVADRATLSASGLNQLKAFVKYVYLESGKASQRIFGSADSAYDTFNKAINAIVGVYEAAGGTKNMPDLVEPSQTIKIKQLILDIKPRQPTTVVGPIRRSREGHDLQNGHTPIPPASQYEGDESVQSAVRFLEAHRGLNNLSISPSLTPAPAPGPSRNKNGKRPVMPSDVETLQEKSAREARMHERMQQHYERSRADMEKAKEWMDRFQEREADRMEQMTSLLKNVPVEETAEMLLKAKHT